MSGIIYYNAICPICNHRFTYDVTTSDRLKEFKPRTLCECPACKWLVKVEW